MYKRQGGDLCILKSTTAMLLYGTSPDIYQVTRMSGEMGTICLLYTSECFP